MSNSIRVIAPKEKALRYFAIIDDKEEIQAIFGKESEALENANTEPNWKIISLTGKYIKK